MVQIIKRLLPVAAITGGFWLYCNSHNLLVSRSISSANAPNPVVERSQKRSIPAKSVTKSSTTKAKPALTTTPANASALEPTRLEIDISSRTVAFYLGNMEVERYPIAIGRSGWETPKGRFKVLQMQENPNWINPLTNKKVPAGDPKNPLGGYWIGFWTDGRDWVGFHGTPDRQSVGKAVSHGCIRMYNEDIEQLFYQVSPGTQVIVKQ